MIETYFSCLQDAVRSMYVAYVLQLEKNLKAALELLKKLQQALTDLQGKVPSSPSFPPL